MEKHQIVVDCIAQVQEILLEYEEHNVFRYGILGMYWLLIYAKFFFGLVTLTTAVISTFSVITNTLPEFIAPTIISQTIEYVLLSTIELFLATITVQCFVPCHKRMLIFYVIKLMTKISIGIWTVNKYTDLYVKLKKKQAGSLATTDATCTCFPRQHLKKPSVSKMWMKYL